ncbi:transcriptional regulator, LacI family [Serinicoccus hydrothermalis]|uniref:Transcriptional regulator, LacI family n=1 Tax=Serinicoccus hydrothermalis TaxID=1758689 RepID=A0A1B1NCI6_9MICO|nr:LacI family DNA-binding transcriptional regulator [Serinicoccus hydrothermalis]ANS79124.1 transcriptional regulator, LacI family [Serinicoccus hydrothermalis]
MRREDAHRRATINDVARAAAVSRQTVSNVLNKPHLVRPETLERVRQEVDRLGYRPSQAAQGMRSQRAGAVGIELNAVQRAGSDVAQLFLTELTVAAPRFDVHLVPFAHESTFPAVEGYQDMVRRRLVDAFVLSDTHVGDPRPEWLLQTRIPFAAFGRLYDQPELTCWADVDGASGTAQAVEHLHARGYRRVAYLGWPHDRPASAVAEARWEGWSTAASARGTAGPEGTCEQDLTDATRAADALLEPLEPGDAVVCASDLLALGVVYAAYARGWRVGPDLGVVGFDGSLIASRHGLTTVEQPLALIAAALLGGITDQLTGGALTPSGQLLEPTLTPGPSTDRSATTGIPITAPEQSSRR